MRRRRIGFQVQECCVIFLLKVAGSECVCGGERGVCVRVPHCNVMHAALLYTDPTRLTTRWKST